MREVLKWNEDHTTGKRTELKCLKPDNGLIGRATIQVFDEYGDLKNETFTENIIPNWYTTHDFYRNQFSYIKDGKHNSSTQYNSKAFQQILLTNSQEDERENGISIKGDIIGWCPRVDQQAGSDTTRGVYNPTESVNGELTPDRFYHCKLVYDFGTSQGCGTFQSIYWKKGSRSDSNIGKFSTYEFVYLHPKLPLDSSLRNNYNGHIVKNHDGGWREVLNITEVLNREATAKLSSETEKFENSTKTVISESGEKMLATVENIKHTTAGYDGINITEDKMTSTFDIVLYNSEGAEVKRIHMDYFTIDTDARVYIRRKMHVSDYIKCTSNDINWNNGDMNIFFEGRSLYKKFPTVSSSGITSEEGTEYINTNGVYNIFTEEWVRKPSIVSWDSRKRSRLGIGSNHSKATIDGEQYIYGNTDNTGYTYWIRDGALDFTHSFRNDDCADSWFGAGQWCYVEEHRAMILSHDNKVAIITPYSAHTKLPAPITKTNKDTMKITYDYYIQVPYNFSSTGDYLTPPPSEG